MSAQSGFASQSIGFGTWPFTGDEAARAVVTAIHAGYRLIDTASKYENEADVGRGIAASGVRREELFIQTKLRGNDHGDVRGALQRSLDWLGVDYLDSWLIHWPLPMLGLYRIAFQQMAQAKDEGLVREIGVSNFLPEHLDVLRREAGLIPAVNQIAVDPSLSRPELRAELDRRGIQAQAWSPLARGGEVLSAKPVVEVAGERGITPAQVVLAWHHAIGTVPIVRSRDPHRQQENLDAMSIELTADEVDRVSSLPQRELGANDPRIRDER